MIFSIKKALFNEIKDYRIKPNHGVFEVRVAKLTKGYYLYDKNGVQVGQIVFSKGNAKIVVPDSSAIDIVLIDEKNRYMITDGICSLEDEKSIEKVEEKKENLYEYMIYGKPEEYRFDIYEKKKGEKLPRVSANIINDISNNAFYKVRIVDTDNLLKTLMICLAIDKLNLDPESNF